MDSSQYASLAQNLNNSSHVAGYRPPVLEQKTRDIAESGRSAIEGVGGYLTQESMGKSLKAMSKSKKIMKGMGATQEEMDGLAEAGARGDMREVVGRGLNMGANRLKEAVGRQIGRVVPNGEVANPAFSSVVKAEPIAKAVGGEANVPEGLSNTSQIQPNLESEGVFGRPFNAPKLNNASSPENVGRNMITSGNDSSAVSKINPSAIESAPSQEVLTGGETLKSGANVGNDVGNSATKLNEGEDVVDDLKKATKVSGEADEDPVNLAITAGLGLATIVGGMFIKTHHAVNIIPKNDPLPTANYGVQMGA